MILNLWVKCVSAERGHGSKSRVHFLGYSLSSRVGQRVSLEETAKIKCHKKLRITKENHRNQAIPVISGGDYWTRTSGLMRVKKCGDFGAGNRKRPATCGTVICGSEKCRNCMYFDFYSNCAPDKKHFQLLPNISNDQSIFCCRTEKINDWLINGIPPMSRAYFAS